MRSLPFLPGVGRAVALRAIWSRHALPICADRFGDYRKIPLTQGRFVNIDPADCVWLAQSRWHCKTNGNTIDAVRIVQVAGESKRIYMHRLIVNAPEHLVCDHLNHDGLDNHRWAPTPTSQYPDVSRHKRCEKWVAYIKKDGKQELLGSFDTEIEAAEACDRAAHALHGPFAHLNFPHQEE
jgi:hypothetical protein